MKKLLTCGMLLALASCHVSTAFAQTAQTFVREDGTVQTVIPVVTQKCEVQSKSNLGNAAIGAGTGYVAGRVIGGRRSNFGLIGMAAGALIGANVQEHKSCFYRDTIIGYRVLSLKDGKSTEVFVPAK